ARPRPDSLRGMTRVTLSCPLRQASLVCLCNLLSQRFSYKRPSSRRQRFDPNILYLVRLRGTERQRRTQRRTLDGPQHRRSFAYIAEVPQSGLELLAGHGTELADFFTVEEYADHGPLSAVLEKLCSQSQFEV